MCKVFRNKELCSNLGSPALERLCFHFSFSPFFQRTGRAERFVRSAFMVGLSGG